MEIATLPASAGEAGHAGQPLAQTYIVGNPHDQEETIDLFIRPVSIPPDWKLSITNVLQPVAGPGPTPTPDPAQPQVEEVEPGRHYRVRLPARGEIQVTSLLVPVGEIGAHTSAHWAVEGKIRDELIGGMVHEMNVPYVVVDLGLPPVGSVEAGDAQEPGTARANWPLYAVAAAIGLLVLAIAVVLIARLQVT